MRCELSRNTIKNKERFLNIQSEPEALVFKASKGNVHEDDQSESYLLPE